MAQAVRATTDARKAVQGLRLLNEDADLVASLAAIREEVATDATPRTPIDILVEGTPRSLEPMVKAEVYRIADEAVRNAWHHARARHITLDVAFDTTQFRLRVSDDGEGIDEDVVRQARPPAGHFGLQGMRERAELLGGRLEVWSKRGSGTRIHLTIPAHLAYVDGAPARGLWHWLFRHRNVRA
jgi:signal transduction histidine kinase